MVTSPQFSSLTLREALQRYYAQHAAVLSDRELSPEAQAFFRCHDVAHVVFDCDTSLYGEGMVKIYTIFGTTLGFWKHLSGYAEADAWRLFRQYSWRHVARHLLRLIMDMPRALLRARRMSRPWPWDGYERHLDQPLDQIRKAFNIATLNR